MIQPYEKTKLAILTKGEVRRAGEVLKAKSLQKKSTLDESIAIEKAKNIAIAWRSLHKYPLNTFQALLRQKLKAMELPPLVAQRLKRMPTIINKLSRMQGTLETMQDIGGIRVVLPDIVALRAFEEKFCASRFQHELLNNRCRDYISHPKQDGYRGVHLIYKCFSAQSPKEVQGLTIELQLRTELQHYWATAVEAVDMFYGKSLKIGQKDNGWSEFFLLVSAAFALSEQAPLPTTFAHEDKTKIYKKLKASAARMKAIAVFEQMQQISEKFRSKQNNAYYHLLVFYPDELESRVLHMPFPKKEQKRAEQIYADMENLLQGQSPEVVLVASDPKDLEKLYSNYFLNVDGFLKALKEVLA